MAQPYLKATTINLDSTTSPTYFNATPTIMPGVAGSYNFAAFWRPKDTGLSIGGTQYYYTGLRGAGTMNTSATQAYIPLTPQLVFAPSDGNVSGAGSLLAAPTGFINMWSWNNSVYMWQPVAPAGYIALGFVFTSSSTVPTAGPTGTFPKFMCVRQDLCSSVLINPDYLIWSNNFALTPNMWISMWSLPNASNCTMISSFNTYNSPPGYNYSNTTYVPPHALVWDLKQPAF